MTTPILRIKNRRSRKQRVSMITYVSDGPQTEKFLQGPYIKNNANTMWSCQVQCTNLDHRTINK